MRKLILWALIVAVWALPMLSTHAVVKAPMSMVLEPGASPQDSILHFKDSTGTYAKYWTIVAEIDTCRFYIYYQRLIGQTPNYVEHVLAPGTAKSWGIDASFVRADSIQALRKSTNGKAQVDMYP